MKSWSLRIVASDYDDDDDNVMMMIMIMVMMIITIRQLLLLLLLLLLLFMIKNDSCKNYKDMPDGAKNISVKRLKLPRNCFS